MEARARGLRYGKAPVDGSSGGGGPGDSDHHTHIASVLSKETGDMGEPVETDEVRGG
jgi:hypothetical protein